MPSSYTANGGIELPANGEQSGTWGETVNDNMSIIDRLTNGVGSISLSGLTHTLTTNNGSLSDGQYKVIILGGSPSGTNTITISPNTGQHIYIVKNTCGQTAIFTQGSGGDVSVLNNTTKIIYSTGVGGGSAVVDITAAIDLGSLIIGGTTVNSSAAELNLLDGSAAGTIINSRAVIYSAAGQVNATTLALAGTPLTASAAELNYVTGATSSIQVQLDSLFTGPSFVSPITVTGGTNDWTLTAAGTDLTFAYNGTNVMRIDSLGNFTVVGNVNTVGTIS